ncbi:MAG: hypothetical protein IKP52_00995 [Prevotella sp.]|nr:hypothetical protein [Prevotella sp.]
MMKRLSLAIIFGCFALAMAAQEAVRVNYQGAKPTISDFITAYLAPTYGEDGECDSEAMNGVRDAWKRYCKGQKQSENVTFTLDNKNGFAVYEYKYWEGACEFMTRIEMCLWNEADGKHKLFGYNHRFFRDDQYYPGQYDGVSFMRYTNATKTMKYYTDASVQAVYEEKAPSVECSFSLPRSGKDIIVTFWDENGKTAEKTLKWNGSGFSW